MPHPDNPGNPCDIQFWALFGGSPLESDDGGSSDPRGQLRSFAPRWGQMERGVI